MGLAVADTMFTGFETVVADLTLSGDPLPVSVAPSSVQEIVFIDGSVPNAQSLAAGVNAGVQAVVLDPGLDGVDQIARYLASHNARNLAAIAIVSHGADGVLFLGSAELDAGTIGQYQTQLALIGAALGPGGGLLLYGCDVAQDAAGVAFIDQLSAATGGVNIAAASHLIGAAEQGGSFTLDVNTGQIAAPTPFTVQTQTSFNGVLPTAVNQLYFSVSNIAPTSTVNRVNQIGVSGTTTIGAAVDLIDGSQAIFGNGTTVISLPGVAVDPAAGKFFFTDTNSNASYDKIWMGTIASPGGTLTQIVSTPTTTTQVQGLAIDQPNGNLYYALNASSFGSIGIYEVSESGGTPVQVVSGFTSAAHALFQIALDVPDNLVFFADSPGISSVSTLWVGNLVSHTETALTTSAKGARLEGVAFNNGTVYWSTLNGGTIANNNIFSAPVTVTGSGSVATASIGTTSTLYAGAATGNGTIANTPISLAVDPVTGVLYTGSNIISGGSYQAIVNAGTVTGGSSMTTIFSSPFGGTAAVAAPIVALTLESTPTVSASGSVNAIIGGSAVTIAPSASVSNPSGFNLASATVAITGGTFANDGDTLTATTTGTGITASFSGETLTLSGNDTLAHYHQVLDSVAFKSTAVDPGNGGANLTRTVSWTVSDGVIASTTPTSTIKVHGLPVVTASGSVSFTGGDPALTLDSGLTVTDIYSTTLNSATVTAGGFLTGDTLTVGTPGGLTPSFSNGTLTLTGVASVATYQTALASVAYNFAAGNDPTGGGADNSRAISWVVNDGVTSSAAASSSLNVQAGAVCFAAGTLILTTRGEVLVEHLTTSDHAVTVSDGVEVARPVKWVGRRRIDLAAHPRPATVAPIRIARGAVADSVPRRDLLVSPDHAIFIDGVLICARQLINGTTIRQDATYRSIEYFHVELDAHALLQAEGLPAESYLDTGNRGFFSNSGAPLVLHPDLALEAGNPTREMDSCAPFVWDAASVLPVWQRLEDRAIAMAPHVAKPRTTSEPDLHLVADGRPIRPIRGQAGPITFILPRGTAKVRLVSRAGSPTDARPWLGDRRQLGVRVARIVLRDRSGACDLPLDSPDLTEGWWTVEPEGISIRRWTDGDAVLPLPAFDGPSMLEVYLDGKMIYLMESSIPGERWAERKVA